MEIRQSDRVELRQPRGQLRQQFSRPAEQFVRNYVAEREAPGIIAANAG
jgi:hypothetical protein